MGAIVWLASYPKSGNTWMRAFLHNLMRNPSESYDINRLTDLTLGESQTYWFKKLDPRSPLEYSDEDIMRMRGPVQEMITRTSPDSVFVKTHNALMTVYEHELVVNAFTAGAIYIVRNPLDVTISYSHHLGKTIDEMIDFMESREAVTLTTERNVFEYLSNWSDHVDSWTKSAKIERGKIAEPQPQLHVVRYEDMLEAPMRTFTSVTRFLGLDAPRERIDKAIKLSSFKVLQAQERRRGFSERSDHAEAFFREGKAGQWKKQLTPAQITRIQELHGEQMRRFGYL